MDADTEIKAQVRAFYNRVGWQKVGECCYQNARFEDLRPVSQDYIHHCHLRVGRHLKPEGRYLLDAGSGPIQYPEYLQYSHGYRYRVCADISHLALQEARERIGEHGLYVVADVAHLPFPSETFEAVVSLHTIHHLPEGEHLQAYQELFRVLAPDSAAVVVNGWRRSLFMDLCSPLIRLARFLRRGYRRATKRPDRSGYWKVEREAGQTSWKTYTCRPEARWLERVLTAHMPVELYVWRSVSTAFLRNLVYRRLGGRRLLGFIYRLEEQWPRFFGRYGEYPLIVLRKPGLREGRG